MPLSTDLRELNPGSLKMMVTFFTASHSLIQMHSLLLHFRMCSFSCS